jgi:hypothetical protein
MFGQDLQDRQDGHDLSSAFLDEMLKGCEIHLLFFVFSDFRAFVMSFCVFILSTDY